MASEGKDVIAFACQACGKRLKASRKAVGKRVKCPKCGQTLQVPAPQPPQPAPSVDDPFRLDVPAIGDLAERDQSAAAIRAGHEQQREAKRQRAAPKDKLGRVEPIRAAGVPTEAAQASANLDAIPFDSDQELSNEPAPVGAQSVDAQSASSAGQPVSAEGHKSPPGPDRDLPDGDSPVNDEATQSRPRRSVFDDDLPDLDQLVSEPEPTPIAPEVVPAAPGRPPAQPQRSSGQAAKRTPAGSRSTAGGKVVRNKPAAGQPPAATPPEKTPQPSASSSFLDNLDDELPLAPASPPPARKSPVPVGLGDLDDLMPDLGAAAELPPLYDEDDPVDSEYRIACKICGTAQYVSPSAEGMKIKCPDCFVEYNVPPPPPGWKPKPKKKKPKKSATDIPPLAPPEPNSAPAASLQERDRTQAILEKAKQEISDEELEQLYDYDFDATGFAQRTFGFLGDFITMFQVVGYGVVFAAIFALAQFSANDFESDFGRGVLLLTVIMVPIVAMLFALPMLSGGLALIESVANKQRRVREIPAFNMFDNVGELILIVAAVAASIVPGFLFGNWLAGDAEAGVLIRVSGMMLTCFACFPVFLLSMLDNNSIFQPVSSSVTKSIAQAAEAWGSYYLKTLVGFFVVLMLWYVLLGRSPLLAGLGGFLLPWLWFFLCQQIGALADSISDHLSFELAPAQDGDADDELAAE